MAGGLNNRLLLSVLRNLATIRHTLELHSRILKSLSTRMNGTADVTSTELLQDVAFPLRNSDDVDKLEAKLLDLPAKKAMVKILQQFINNHCYRGPL